MKDPMPPLCRHDDPSWCTAECDEMNARFDAWMQRQHTFTADDYTRMWFYGGGFRNWFMACYLGYREFGYGPVASALWVVPNLACLTWDWLRHRFTRRG